MVISVVTSMETVVADELRTQIPLLLLRTTEQPGKGLRVRFRPGHDAVFPVPQVQHVT